MKILILVLSILVLSASAFTVYQSAAWSIEESHSVSFSSKNPSGSFQTMEGSIIFDPYDLEHSDFEIKVEVASIATGNGLKNKHARGKNWFEADRFPYITFSSNEVYLKGDAFAVLGKLKMHGVEREVEIPFTFEDNTFKGNLELNRIDYGIGSTKGMSKKVPEVMQVEIVVPVSR
ncbi:MAG: polyisoprenoid-binding protein YceI [Limisphaerales bacterium]|jgi:polyisoprenoid-binding protein YceI